MQKYWRSNLNFFYFRPSSTVLGLIQTELTFHKQNITGSTTVFQQAGGHWLLTTNSKSQPWKHGRRGKPTTPEEERGEARKRMLWQKERQLTILLHSEKLVSNIYQSKAQFICNQFLANSMILAEEESQACQKKDKERREKECYVRKRGSPLYYCTVEKLVSINLRTNSSVIS